MKNIALLLSLTWLISCSNRELRKYHSNGNLKSISSMKDGKLHGVTKIYNEEEELLGIESYEKGVLHGEMVAYYPSGKIMRTIQFENGLKIEESLLEYHPNGVLMSKQDSIYPIRYKYDSIGNLVMKSLVDENQKIIDYVHFNKDGVADYEAEITPYLDFSDTLLTGENFRFVMNSVSLNNFNGDILLDFKKEGEDYLNVAKKVVDADLGYFEYYREMREAGDYELNVSVAKVDPLDTVYIYSYKFRVQ